MKRDGLGDQRLNLFARPADRHTARKVRDVRAPGVSVLFDDGEYSVSSPLRARQSHDSLPRNSSTASSGTWAMPLTIM